MMASGRHGSLKLRLGAHWISWRYKASGQGTCLTHKCPGSIPMLFRFVTLGSSPQLRYPEERKW